MFDINLNDKLEEINNEEIHLLFVSTRTGTGLMFSSFVENLISSSVFSRVSSISALTTLAHSHYLSLHWALIPWSLYSLRAHAWIVVLCGENPTLGPGLRARVFARSNSSFNFVAKIPSGQSSNFYDRKLLATLSDV